MPLYEYKCEECEEIFDKFYPLKEWDAVPDCPICGGNGKKQMVVGGLELDTPTWLDDPLLQGGLQDLDDVRGKRVAPIETRTQLKRHLKENNLEQLTNRMF